MVINRLSCLSPNETLVFQKYAYTNQWCVFEVLLKFFFDRGIGFPLRMIKRERGAFSS